MNISTTYIQPINHAQKLEVEQRTNHYIKLASDLFDTNFARIPITFDIKGKCAGMYRVKQSERLIRYNPYIFSKYYQDNLDETVPHEVAHYISDCLYGRTNIRPHGKEWKQIMLQFGKKPTVTSRYDLAGIPLRQYQYYEYQCSCRQHQLTKYRHHKIVKKKAQYYCRYCKTALIKSKA